MPHKSTNISVTRIFTQHVPTIPERLNRRAVTGVVLARCVTLQSPNRRATISVSKFSFRVIRLRVSPNAGVLSHTNAKSPRRRPARNCERRCPDRRPRRTNSRLGFFLAIFLEKRARGLGKVSSRFQFARRQLALLSARRRRFYDDVRDRREKRARGGE